MDQIPTFDDLLTIRKGKSKMTMGHGPTRMVKITTLDQWQT